MLSILASEMKLDSPPPELETALTYLEAKDPARARLMRYCLGTMSAALNETSTLLDDGIDWARVEAFYCPPEDGFIDSPFGVRDGSGELLEKKLCSRSGRGRILAGDQKAILDHVWSRVCALREDTALRPQFVFDQERHNLGQFDRFFFGVREASHLLAGDEWLALRSGHMAERSRCMAYQCHRLTRCKERLNQLDGVLVFSYVPQRAVSTGIEYRVKILLLDGIEPDGRSKLRLCYCIRLEAARCVRLRTGLVALRVQWRLAALGRREDDVGSCVLERVIRGGEFFEPKPGFFAGIAQLIVRGEDHENFHLLFPLLFPFDT